MSFVENYVDYVYREIIEQQATRVVPVSLSSAIYIVTLLSLICGKLIKLIQLFVYEQKCLRAIYM